MACRVFPHFVFVSSLSHMQVHVTMPKKNNRADFLKVPSRDRLVNIGILPSVNSIKQKRGAKPGISVCFHSMRLMNDRTKSQRKATIPTQEEKATTRIVKIVSQLGCVSQHSDALDSQARKSRGNPMQKILRSIRRIQFTKSTLRQASTGKRKDHRLETYKSKILISEVPTL